MPKIYLQSQKAWRMRSTKETEVLPFMDEVQFPADDYSSKDCSLHQNDCK